MIKQSDEAVIYLECQGLFVGALLGNIKLTFGTSSILRLCLDTLETQSLSIVA